MKTKGIALAVLAAAVLMAVVTVGIGYWGQGESLPAGICADLVVVVKGQRKLHLYQNKQLIKSYNIALGGNPVGAKHAEGDRKTPEGEYVISRKHLSSNFHRSLHVSYPASKDIAYAKKRSIEKVGGDIKIHGLPRLFFWVGSLHALMDWTAGCIAVTDREIDELWRAVPRGTKIQIVP